MQRHESQFSENSEKIIIEKIIFENSEIDQALKIKLFFTRPFLEVIKVKIIPLNHGVAISHSVDFAFDAQ